MAQTQVFRGVERAKTRTSDGSQQFSYRNTAVVTVNPDSSITLDSGGWRTATTKIAMNQASSEAGLGFRVYAKRGEWFVSHRGAELQFTDGMRLN